MANEALPKGKDESARTEFVPMVLPAAAKAEPAVAAAPLAAAAKPAANSEKPAAAKPAANSEKPAAAKPAANSEKAPANKPAAEANGAKSGNAKSGSVAGVVAAAAEPAESGASGNWIRELLRQTPSWLVSMVFHMIVLLALTLLSLPVGGSDNMQQLVVAPGENDQLEDIEELDEPLQEIDMTTDLVSNVANMTEVVRQVKVSPVDEMEAAPMAVELSEFGLEHAPRNDLLATVGAYTGEGLSGRGKGKAGLVAIGGGSAGSEKSVAAALKWLANHQMPDGGWCFNHALSPNCRGACREPGEMAEARTAATAMAILPFLGAGQTHKDGAYKSTVNGGLYFLMNRIKLGPAGADLTENGGRMYSHGLASIVLCEAYAMTRDKALHDPAQAAVNFICYAQDPVGGGWRYEPRQKGDTSVVGWQIMALKSGHMAYLTVPPITVKKAFGYLDTVQSQGGAQYGYADPGGGDATSAIGLLCRMYLGWKKENPTLEKGAQILAQKGPSKDNMYYNYYATQVMRHMEGDYWKNWNSVMRDQLVNSQATTGHETGSWFMNDQHVKGGGRLYCTSLACMILEVYYRHLPIFRKQSTEEDFPE